MTKLEMMYWRPGLACGLLVSAAFATLSFLTCSWGKRAIQIEVYRDLRRIALAVAPTCRDLGSLREGQSRQDLAMRIAGLLAVRAMLLDQEARPLADSAVDVSELESTPIKLELNAEQPVASESGDWMFAAVPVDESNPNAGYLRLGRPVDSLYWSFDRTLRLMLFLSLLPGIAVCATFVVLGARQSRNLQATQQYIDSIADDAGTAQLPTPSHEMESLFQSLANLQSSIWSRHNAVVQERNEFRSLLESIPEGVLAIDSDQTIVFANLSVCRLFGTAPRHVVKKKIWEAFRSPVFLSAINVAFNKPDAHSTELNFLQSQRTVAFRSRRLTSAGKGMIVVLHDISELRRLERVRQEFVASASHELKTPLASIKGYAETLRESNLEDPALAKRFLQRIDEQADRLHALVLDMLTLARAESQDHGFSFRQIDVRESIEQAIDLFRGEAEAKAIAMEVELPAQALYVQADPEGLGTILRNLIDNAIKYTPENGRVTVAGKVDQNAVVIIVSDTGVGIPAEDLARIFERFYRVDKARSRAVGGTGLGLSIVKHLTQILGGDIAVESRLGQGSRFSLRLPARPSPADAMPQSA